MAWTFVGRVELLETLRRGLAGSMRGPVIITGEPGMGRTTVLSRALSFVDHERDMVVRLEPSGETPFAALRASFLPTLPAGATASETVQAIAASAGGRRLVVAADDAHLMDHASLLAMREVSRAGQALLLVTCPLVTGPRTRPDPSDSLRYERGVKLLILRPLGTGEVAVMLAGLMGGPVALATAEAGYAATGGNPRQLRALVTGASLPAGMVRQGESWRLSATDKDPALGAPAQAPGGPVAASGAGPSDAVPGVGLSVTDMARICDATWSAWQGLACERADQLCRLALRLGIREEIAPVWATLLLLRGQAQEAVDFLDSLPGQRVAATPRLSLARALVLAVGLGRVEEASEFLIRAADLADSRYLMLAYRAWISAVTGRCAEACDGLRAITRNDLLETAMFVHATRAMLARLAGRPAEAVFHFRRALATAETGSAGCPWMRPFLTASLIDSMLLSGRAQDAASMARRFHAHEPDSGWELTVALEALLGSRAGPLRESVPTLQQRYNTSWPALTPEFAKPLV